MFIKYGNFQHPANEATLLRFEQIPRFSHRGERYESLYRFTVEGEFCCLNSQAAIHARISSLIAAYAFDEQDIGLYHDDGTATNHVLLNAPSVSGVKIVERSWPHGDMADEYATTRRFKIVAEAVYLEPDSGLLFFQETISREGDTGPQFRLVPRLNAPPLFVPIVTVTSTRVIQSGRAVGLSSYPLLIPLPIWPAWYQGSLSRVDEIGPAWRGNGFTHFERRWQYVHESPVPLIGVPNAA
jgi:hypothetical protein